MLFPRSPHPHSKLSRLLVVLAIAAGTFVTVAAPAGAHDVLISSDPPDGAVLKAIPGVVIFTFDEPVQNFDPVIAITGPDGRSHQGGSVTVTGNMISSAVLITTAGNYTAAFRILSADGHPVTGQIHFSIAAGTSGAGAAPSAGANPASASPAAKLGPSGGLLAAIGVAAVIVAAAVILLLRRPRRAD